MGELGVKILTSQGTRFLVPEVLVNDAPPDTVHADGTPLNPDFYTPELRGPGLAYVEDLIERDPSKFEVVSSPNINFYSDTAPVVTLNKDGKPKQQGDAFVQWMEEGEDSPYRGKIASGEIRVATDEKGLV